MEEQEVANIAYQTAIDAAIKATDAIMPFWPNPENKLFDRKLALEVMEKKGTGNYATTADMIAEATIIETIQSQPLLKGHGILSEESEEIVADGKWRWIIDPIDGTPNFRHGNSEFGICIALFFGNEPVIGLIARPALKQYVIAKASGDAKLFNYDGNEIADLKQLAQAYADPLERALVGFDIGYADRPAQLQTIANKVISDVGYAECLGSFSTGNFRMVQGMMGLYFGFTPTIMDIAPAALILPAVGGVITDLKGNPIDWQANERTYVGAINPKIHQQFIDLINRE